MTEHGPGRKRPSLTPDGFSAAVDLFSCARPQKKRRAQTAVRRPEARCFTPSAKVGFPEPSLFSRNNPQAVVSLVYQPRMKGTKMARFLALTHAPSASVVSSPDVESALHLQTNLAVDFELAPSQPEWGASRRSRIPINLAFKSAKNIQFVDVANCSPGGLLENQEDNRFLGSQSGQLDATISVLAFAIWQAVHSRLSLA
jgi:hypothetical protein